MNALRRVFDPYLMMLIATVAIAAVLPARGPAAGWADQAANGAVMLLFFLYGARLSPGAIWTGLAHWRLQSMVLASTFVVFPVLGLVAYFATRGWLTADLSLGLLYLCLLPSTVQSSIAFTAIARGNVPAALTAASVSNLLGVFITPLLVMLLLPGGDNVTVSLSSIERIALQILAPFVAGQVVRPVLAGWLARHGRLTSMVDRGSILLVVYAAFSAGVVAGVWSRVSVADLATVVVIDGLILAAALVVTTVASRRLGFSRADEIAIVFCGSKKSMASGIPMATILFAAHSASLTVLPLMLFHQIQLFVCTVMAARYGRQASEDETKPAEA